MLDLFRNCTESASLRITDAQRSKDPEKSASFFQNRKSFRKKDIF